MIGRTYFASGNVLAKGELLDIHGVISIRTVFGNPHSAYEKIIQLLMGKYEVEKDKISIKQFNRVK